jgi:hypothetical protein
MEHTIHHVSILWNHFGCHTIYSPFTLVLPSLVLCSTTSRCILIKSLIVFPLGCLWVALWAVVCIVTNFSTFTRLNLVVGLLFLAGAFMALP